MGFEHKGIWGGLGKGGRKGGVIEAGMGGGFILRNDVFYPIPCGLQRQKKRGKYKFMVTNQRQRKKKKKKVPG